MCGKLLKRLSCLLFVMVVVSMSLSAWPWEYSETDQVPTLDMVATTEKATTEIIPTVDLEKEVIQDTTHLEESTTIVTTSTVGELPQKQVNQLQESTKQLEQLKPSLSEKEKELINKAIEVIEKESAKISDNTTKLVESNTLLVAKNEGLQAQNTELQNEIKKVHFGFGFTALAKPLDFDVNKPDVDLGLSLSIRKESFMLIGSVIKPNSINSFNSFNVNDFAKDLEVGITLIYEF